MHPSNYRLAMYVSLFGWLLTFVLFSEALFTRDQKLLELSKPLEIREIQILSKTLREERIQPLVDTEKYFVLVQTGFDLQEIKEKTKVSLTVVTDFNAYLESGDCLKYTIDQISLNRK